MVNLNLMYPNTLTMYFKLLRFSITGIILLSIFTFSGCSTLPGDGGTSTITGKIYVERYNASGTLYQEYYGGDEKVYIIYGDNTAYDDEVRTAYDGTYKFEYLRKGKYTIYAYSDCLTCNGSTEAKIVEVEITENNSVVEIDDIIIENR